MATPFPTLPSGNKPDSQYHGEQLEDPAIRTEIEGGYVASRPRHTRAPRTTYPVHYTEVTAADKAVLKQFWKDMKGGSNTFDWTNPEDGTVIEVRFKEPMQFNYKGIGTTKLWDCSFSVEEA